MLAERGVAPSKSKATKVIIQRVCAIIMIFVLE
jgi:succinate dehydrogenase hydrophobic anchor subunit